MKLKLVAVAVTSLLAAGVVNAAEVYNKDGIKAKRRSTIS